MRGSRIEGFFLSFEYGRDKGQKYISVSTFSKRAGNESMFFKGQSLQLQWVVPFHQNRATELMRTRSHNSVYKSAGIYVYF